MKKLFSFTLSLFLFVGILAACGQDTGNTGGTDVDGGSTDVEQETTSEPTKLTYLADQRDGWIRNYNYFSASIENHVSGFMYEPLVIFNSYQNNEAIMWLAEDVIIEEDNKTLTFKVRQGIKWSDGEDLTAEDVAFTFLYPKDHPEIDRAGSWGENGKIESVTIIDDYTVELVSATESRFNINDFGGTMIIPEHIYSKIDDPATYVLENPVVTGAFSEVKSFSPEMVVLGRNPNYWKGEELQVDELHLPQFNSNDSALSLLQTGQVDWAHIFIPNIEDTYIQGDPNREYWYGMNDGIRISFNYMTENENNLKAFNTPEFKIAASMAVDRQAIIDSAVFGYLAPTVPTVTGLPPALQGYRSEAADALLEGYTTYDLDAAKKVLADGGFVDVDGDGWVENPDGTPIEFEILSPAGWSDWNDGAVIAADGMRAIGINVTAKAIDLGLIIETWETGAHDSLYSGYGLQSNIWKYYFETIGNAAYAKTSSWWTVTQTNYVNEEINALIGEMVTADDARLDEIVEEVEMFFTENMINIPILYNGNWVVYNTGRFTGWATEENPFTNPANTNHDTKILQLLALEAVK